MKLFSSVLFVPAAGACKFKIAGRIFLPQKSEKDFMVGGDDPNRRDFYPNVP